MAQPAESDGYHILYDTKEHTLELVDYIVPTRWKQGVKDFVKTLKDEFRDMSVLPVEPCEVCMVRRCDDEEMAVYKDILRRNGWPSEAYQKDKCLEQLRKAWSEAS